MSRGEGRGSLEHRADPRGSGVALSTGKAALGLGGDPSGIDRDSRV